jgi:hypothetical protein
MCIYRAKSIPTNNSLFLLPLIYPYLVPIGCQRWKGVSHDGVAEKIVPGLLLM